MKKIKLKRIIVVILALGIGWLVSEPDRQWEWKDRTNE